MRDTCASAVAGMLSIQRVLASCGPLGEEDPATALEKVFALQGRFGCIGRPVTGITGSPVPPEPPGPSVSAEVPTFAINHSFGPVTYDVRAVMAARSDGAQGLLWTCLRASAFPFLASADPVRAPGLPGESCVDKEPAIVDVRHDSVVSGGLVWYPCVALPVPGPGPRRSAVAAVVGGPRMSTTDASFAPLAHQLVSMGVASVARHHARGFTHHVPLSAFVRRYGVFVPWDQYVRAIQAGAGPGVRSCRMCASVAGGGAGASPPRVARAPTGSWWEVLPATRCLCVRA